MTERIPHKRRTPLRQLLRCGAVAAFGALMGSVACSRTDRSNTAQPTQVAATRSSGPSSGTVSEAPQSLQLKQQRRAAMPPVGATAAYRIAAAERVVAIGDLHGDFEATLGVLKLVGAIDDKGEWKGGKLIVVQTGDQLDRGDGERQILDLFTRLEPQAEAAGGRIIVLNGNHEVMNVAGDFRYVTPGGFSAFADVTSPALPPAVAAQLPPTAHGRAIAFLPGGPYARLLAQRPIIAQVGETVFVHGGVLEKHIEYGIDRINRETSEWMRGARPQLTLMASEDAPVWSRQYSMDVDSSACAQLARVLLRMGAKRMVVGHTVQRNGVSSACKDRIWRIDVGMAEHYGGSEFAALEISRAGVRVLRTAKDGVQQAVGQ